ncbi:MAG: hypothetical protein IID33_01295 [Planctomycetes bacterium]|nr:hypothetical protein [Planctomycetota bacterium]
MRPVWAIAKQTFWEGMRMRIVLVSVIVLVLIILRLPYIMRGDETLAGRLQTFLAYSFGALGLFAGLATVFFSCSTLANEIKNCQLHMVVTKPVSRFQILLGKWLGVNLLNLLIVLICSIAIYAFARQIAGRQEQFARDRMKVRDVIWTARTAASPIIPDITPGVEAFLADKIATGVFVRDSFEAKKAAADKEIELLNRWRVLKPGEMRRFDFENLTAPDDPSVVLQVRVRARGNPLPRDEVIPMAWYLLDPESGAQLHPNPTRTEARSGDVIQFLFRGQAAIKNGKASLLAVNIMPDGSMPGHDVMLEGDDWLQIMYRVGGFEANFVRNVVMVLAKLAFLSAIGLMFAVFVSFPIACMCTFVAFLVVVGWDWWFDAIGGNIEIYSVDVDPYGRVGPFVRFILEPFMMMMPNFNEYNGTNKLIAGEIIPNATLFWCLLKTLGLGGILLLIVGWSVFSRKEIAEITV